MKINQETVKAIPLPKGKAADVIHWDDAVPGFGLRLRGDQPRGAARWVVQYKVGAKHRRMTFGKLAELDATKAREKAKDLLSAVRLGKDPAGEKLEARGKAGETFKAAIAPFLVRQEKRLRPRYYEDTARYLEVHCKGLHGLALEKIGRANVATLLGEIAAERGPVSADRCGAALSAFFTWAMKEGRIENNPVISTNKHSENEARDRVLTNAELAEIWHALPDNDYGPIVKLLILTGQRRDEIGALRWSEMPKGEQLIALPRERTKNHLPHDVPLSDLASDILGNIQKDEERDLVFGRRAGPFSGWSKAKKDLDEAIAAARAKKHGAKARQMPPWRLHDIRRTVATRMAEDLGVQPHIVEAVLNHVSGHKAGVAGIYNRATYAAEKAAALKLWADHVAGVVGQHV